MPTSLLCAGTKVEPFFVSPRFQREQDGVADASDQWHRQGSR
jgi:hypothetical protein